MNDLIQSIFKDSLGKRLFVITLVSILFVLSLSEFLAYRFYVKSQLETISAAEIQKVMTPRAQLDYFLVNYVDNSMQLIRDLELRKGLVDMQSDDPKIRRNGFEKAQLIAACYQ